MNMGMTNDVRESLLSKNKSTYQEQSFNLKKAFILVAAVAVIGCIGLACMKNDQTGFQQVALWEKECYSCTHCEGEKFEIIAAFYGDRIITGELVHMYNNGERSFAAGDSVWGETWTDTKKTLVVVFWNCGSYYTRVIYEGQALVLP